MPPRRLTASDLIYDAATHTTRTPDGVDVPHVTHVLKSVGVTKDFEELSDINARLRSNVANASLRGTAVHADCHAFDDDDLEDDYFDRSGDGRIVPFVKAWARVREDKRLKPIVHARERHVFHPLLLYTGIQDGIFESDLGLILVDLKTGDPEDAAAHIQTAAYEAAWRCENKKTKIAERWAVWLRPERKIPYTIMNYSARPDASLDFDKFAACVTVYYEQADRRRKVA